MFSQKMNLTWFATTHNFANLTKNHFENEIKVIFHLAQNMDTNNLIKITQIQMADELKIHKTHLSKILKNLIKLNIIKKNKNPKEYMINPYYFYVGNHNMLKEKQEYYNNL